MWRRMADGSESRLGEPGSIGSVTTVPSDGDRETEVPRPRRRFLLARALWDARRDRRKARELASAARDDYARAGDGFKAQVDEVDRWLARRPSR